jgi:preprotein translocase subunit SecD
MKALERDAPAGVSDRHARVLTVPRGVVVVQATPADTGRPAAITAPHAQFYVLLDHVALGGSQITQPKRSTDSAGQPDVAFRFTPTGARRFTAMTAEIAHRGSIDSGLAGVLDQHFAVVLDGELFTVPSIDFRQYPDGVIANEGAQITGNFTTQTARDIAIDLRYGPLPLQLKQG